MSNTDNLEQYWWWEPECGCRNRKKYRACLFQGNEDLSIEVQKCLACFSQCAIKICCSILFQYPCPPDQKEMKASASIIMYNNNKKVVESDPIE